MLPLTLQRRFHLAAPISEELAAHPNQSLNPNVLDRFPHRPADENGFWTAPQQRPPPIQFEAAARNVYTALRPGEVTPFEPHSGMYDELFKFGDADTVYGDLKLRCSQPRRWGQWDERGLNPLRKGRIRRVLMDPPNRIQWPWSI